MSKSLENPILKETILALSRHDVGSKLESIGVQSAVVLLIYLDLIACITLHVAESETLLELTQDTIEILPNLLISFLNFTLFGFLLELSALIYAFGWSVFSHFGYVLDLMIVSITIYYHIYSWTSYPLRFLVVFRVWRVVRLMNSIVRLVQEKLDSCKAKLSKSRQELKQIELDNSHLEESIKKEMKLRESAEKMIQSYQDEIDTLNEALKIAAMDILNRDRQESANGSSMGILEEGDENVDKFYDSTITENNNGRNDSMTEVNNEDNQLEEDVVTMEVA